MLFGVFKQGKIEKFTKDELKKSFFEVNSKERRVYKSFPFKRHKICSIERQFKQENAKIGKIIINF